MGNGKSEAGFYLSYFLLAIPPRHHNTVPKVIFKKSLVVSKYAVLFLPFPFIHFPFITLFKEKRKTLLYLPCHLK